MASWFSYIQLSLQHRKIETEVETLNGKTLQNVGSYIAQGWQKSQNQLNPELKPYYSLRDEFIIVNDIVFKGSKIVLPSTLIKEMKQILHTGHLAINKIQCHINSVWTQY